MRMTKEQEDRKGKGIRKEAIKGKKKRKEGQEGEF